MRALARFSFRRRRLVLLLWVIGLLGAGVATATASYNDSFSLPDTESTRAYQQLKAVSPAASGDQVTVVAAVRSGSVTDPTARQHLTAALEAAKRSPEVADVRSPYDPAGARQISPDGRVAFATVTLRGRVPNDITSAKVQDVVSAVRGQAGDGVQLEVTGPAVQQQPSQGPAELIGVIAAGIVLFLAFGSALAMTLPLLTALLGLGVGIGLVGLLSNVLTVATFGPTLAVLLGLGVGIDYALFIVTRHRQGLLDGRDPEEAAVAAVDTSGRAVLFAGMTVCIALLGLFALGLSFLYGVAVAASLTVAMTVLSALTLLPALLGFYGQKVLSRRQRTKLAAGQLSNDGESRGWARWAGFLQRRPAIMAVLAAIIVGVIAIPFFSLRLGVTDQGSDPRDSTTRKGYDLLAQGFGPGFNGPLLIVTEQRSQPATAPTDAVVAALRADPGVAAVTPPVYLGGGAAGGGKPGATPMAGGISLVTAYPKSAPQDAATSDLLSRLRAGIAPRATSGTDQRVLVGGGTATFADFSTVISNKLPLFIGVVVLLSFLLLAAVFRSLLVPLVAAAMNLLAAGAAFGVVVAVFQWGWLSSVFGIERTGPVIAFLPVILFAILFGLSMDYEVFLVSRIHEEWVRRRDNTYAVTHGLAATGRTINAAAAIMMFVFLAFLLGSEVTIKTFGLGLAAAVFVDALVIRSVLVPSLMLLLGRSNWWLPRWLDRALPHLAVEGSEVADESAAAAPAAAADPAAVRLGAHRGEPGTAEVERETAATRG